MYRMPEVHIQIGVCMDPRLPLVSFLLRDRMSGNVIIICHTESILCVQTGGGRWVVEALEGRDSGGVGCIF